MEDLLACTDPAGKVQLILSRVKSLVDFIDIFKADCLFDNDYRVLFELLGDMKLSILARIIFVDELLERPDAFSLSRAISSSRSAETKWVNQLAGFLLLSEERHQTIESPLKN
ncbi:MAG: hypothetical protein ACM3UW_03420 [Bacillota bacterium]